MSDNDSEEDLIEDENEDWDESLIAAIRLNPILWDHTRKDYKKSRDVKAGAWHSVAAVVGKQGIS